MFHQFIKTAFRHFAQQKLYTVLNVSGLALGVGCLLLALLYWLDERSYDGFHKNADHLYRITTSLIDREGASPRLTGGTGQVQGPAFKAAVPEVRDFVRVLGGDVQGDLRSGDQVLKAQLLFADSNFFEMFSFPFVHGDSGTALRELNSVVMTERTALRLFQTTDAVGKLLDMPADPSNEKLGHKPLAVTGVVKDPPTNSSIQFDVLLPFRYLQLSFEDKNWLNAYLGTFILLDEKATVGATTVKFNQVFEKNATEQITAAGFDPKISYGLQPITDLHLNMLLGNTGWHEGGTVGESRALYSNLFLGIAFFIFLLAGINFVNISLAGSLKRSKEVGIRKMAGSSRGSLVAQFVGETALLCAIAIVLALVAIEAALPFFNALADKKFVYSEVLDWRFCLGLLGVFVGASLLSGLYPAVMLSAFKPGEILYNRSRPMGQSRFGKALVVLQFSLAFLLLVGTVVFYQQLNFIQNKSLGYDPGYVVRAAITGDRDYEAVKRVLKNELMGMSGIEDISFGGGFGHEAVQTKFGGGKIMAVHQSIDANFLSVMGLSFRLGQNFNAENSNEVIVNETYVRQAGLKDPIGQFIQLNPDYADRQEPFRIAGVVADYHFESLHQPIQPLVLYQLPRNSGEIWLKIRKERSREALQKFEAVYRKTLPDASFEFHFLTDLNAREYDREQRWQKIVSLAAALALLICCLGLFGISHLSALQRTKEIGVRKVLGASVPSVVALLSKEFLLLVILSMVIASPLAYFLMEKWLEDFTYRIDIQWTVFVVAGLAAVVVALLTVAIQSIKAALANPVKSLRNE
ncbi:MAG: ABC transporter permease [Saprospiraceae bacterium]|nr:ABC transporter permease [Saprospiraceae bacterium]